MVETLEEAMKWDADNQAALKSGLSIKDAAALAWNKQNVFDLSGPGQSTCPYCEIAYYTHSKRKGTMSEASNHMKGKCK